MALSVGFRATAQEGRVGAGGSVTIAAEETKSGLSLPEAEEILQSDAFRTLQHVQLTGVMGVATFTNDEDQLRREFRELRGYFELLKQRYFAPQPAFKEISMGMSADYKLAIEEGSTLIRVGSAIFGARPVPQG